LEYQIANSKKDKVKKWVLPVEETKISETDEIEYFVSFPDDLLEAADLKEGDKVEWIDNGDGTWMIRKVTKPITMEQC
jgi:bifunctional DNA-binding transcriptional regulator/antitoxin component of YhaV-PrlF toxin-antitoxin module